MCQTNFDDLEDLENHISGLRRVDEGVSRGQARSGARGRRHLEAAQVARVAREEHDDVEAARGECDEVNEKPPGMHVPCE